jgi:hypothetical protein
LKRKSFREHPNAEALAFGNQTPKDEGDTFLKRKSSIERPNAKVEATTFNKQEIKGEGDAFLKRKRFKQSAIMQNKNRTTSENKQHTTIANKET